MLILTWQAAASRIQDTLMVIRLNISIDTSASYSHNPDSKPICSNIQPRDRRLYVKNIK